MTTSTCKARIRGILNVPTVTEVNVRSGPSTTHALIFKKAVGLSDLPVLEVKTDTANAALQGKVYQWFKLGFGDGQSGWVRDDLLEIVGDCSTFGYGVLNDLTYAFAKTRAASTSTTPPPMTAPPVTTPSVTSPPPAQASIGDLERIRKAAFNITAAFEGSGYAAYQNYDRGVISYGRFQFALTGGLGAVVERYLMRSNSDTAVQLRPYLSRIKAVDESLRPDTRLRDLLIAAASEQVMRDVQDEVATENYWNRVMEISLRPRNIQSPLGIAMLFDTAIQYGIMHSLIGMSEDDLGVPRKSKVGENGITEQQLITQVAERRKRGLYAQAERENLPGLRLRADFWVDRTQAGDWGLQGDAMGQVNINGKIIPVRMP